MSGKLLVVWAVRLHRENSIDVAIMCGRLFETWIQRLCRGQGIEIVIQLVMSSLMIVE
jgi:hypothetical protein